MMIKMTAANRIDEKSILMMYDRTPQTAQAMMAEMHNAANRANKISKKTEERGQIIDDAGKPQ